MKFGTPFAEMDYYAIFPAIGPVPLDKASEPPTYGLDAAVDRSLQDREVHARTRSSSWSERPVGPEHRPGPPPARRQVHVQVRPEPADGRTRPMLSDNEERDDVVTALHRLGHYNKAQQRRPEDQVLVGPQPCTGFLVRRTTRRSPSIEVRQASRSPTTTRTSGRGRRRRHPGQRRHRPASWAIRSAAAGHARPHRTWNGPDGETIEFDPEKAKELLAEAGYEPGEYESAFGLRRHRPRGQGRHGAAPSGLRGGRLQGQAVPLLRRLDCTTCGPTRRTRMYKKINMLGTAWCQDWPSAATFIPPLVRDRCSRTTPATSREQSVDDEIEEIQTLPIEEQADAWGELEKTVMTGLPARDQHRLLPDHLRHTVHDHRWLRQRHRPSGCTRTTGPSTSSSDVWSHSGTLKSAPVGWGRAAPPDRATPRL